MSKKTRNFETLLCRLIKGRVSGELRVKKGERKWSINLENGVVIAVERDGREALNSDEANALLSRCVREALLASYVEWQFKKGPPSAVRTEVETLKVLFEAVRDTRSTKALEEATRPLMTGAFQGNREADLTCFGIDEELALFVQHLNRATSARSAITSAPGPKPEVLTLMLLATELGYVESVPFGSGSVSVPSAARPAAPPAERARKPPQTEGAEDDTEGEDDDGDGDESGGGGNKKKKVGLVVAGDLHELGLDAELRRYLTALDGTKTPRDIVLGAPGDRRKAKHELKRAIQYGVIKRVPLREARDPKDRRVRRDAFRSSGSSPAAPAASPLARTPPPPPASEPSPVAPQPRPTRVEPPAPRPEARPAPRPTAPPPEPEEDDEDMDVFLPPAPAKAVDFAEADTDPGVDPVLPEDEWEVEPAPTRKKEEPFSGSHGPDFDSLFDSVFGEDDSEPPEPPPAKPPPEPEKPAPVASKPAKARRPDARQRDKPGPPDRSGAETTASEPVAGGSSFEFDAETFELDFEPEQRAPPGPRHRESARKEVAAPITAERSRKVAEGMTALARAASSFLLYDPSNDAIREFLEEYETGMQAAVEDGTLVVHVHPFDLMIGTPGDFEVVYRETDREKSLAFRMYRDGVRKLSIAQGVQWQELLKLLEVLSIRFTGIRQQEDDIVTLLWKAGFEHITVDAVEGFLPEEDDEDDGEDTFASKLVVSTEAVPDDWDRPLVELGERVPVRHQVLDAGKLSRIRDETAQHALADVALQLVRGMLEVCSQDRDALADTTGLLEEVRAFLTAEGQLTPLLAFVQMLRTAAAQFPEVMENLLSGIADEASLYRFIRTVPKDAEEAPPELHQLLATIGEHHLAHLVHILEKDRTPATRRVVIDLVQRFLPPDPRATLALLGEVDPDVAADLLKSVVKARPDQAVDAACAVAMRAEVALQRGALDVFEAAAPDRNIHEAVRGLLRSEHSRVRARAIPLLAAYGDLSDFELLRAHAEKRSGDMETKEADEVGAAMARLNPLESAEVMTNWIRPSGLLGRLAGLTGSEMLHWVAVAGLERLEDEEHDKVLAWLSKKAGEKLHHRCEAAIARRRRAQRSRDG